MFQFAKPEVELIHTIAPIEYIENGENRMYSNEMRQKTNNGLIRLAPWPLTLDDLELS